MGVEEEGRFWMIDGARYHRITCHYVCITAPITRAFSTPDS